MFIHNLLISCFHLFEKGITGRAIAPTVFTAFLMLPFTFTRNDQLDAVTTIIDFPKLFVAKADLTSAGVALLVKPSVLV
jgi:hypothetical protein